MDGNGDGVGDLSGITQRLRRSLPALTVGDYREIQGEGDLLCYLREYRGQRIAVALSLGAEPLRFELPSAGGRILLSTNLDREAEPVKAPLELRGNEGLVVELEAFSLFTARLGASREPRRLL